MTDTKIRICNSCQKPKPETLDHFYPRKVPGRTAFKSTCRECRRLFERQGYVPPPKEERPLPASSKVCNLCANQTWRVVGPRCRGCKRLYEAEPKVELVTHRHFERAV